MNNIEFLTIQERIELFRKNMAFSPSDAARRVAFIAEAAMSDLIDYDDKFGNKGKSKLDDGSATYSEFCSDLKSAISKELRKTDKSPYESRFGNIYSDYIYSAALSLASLPHRLESYYDSKPPIYYSLRMTVGNYLDALIDISYDSEKGKPNTRRANQYRKLEKEFSGIIDLSTPLCEAISILLNQYSHSHAELDRLNHIQRCKSDLDRFIQMDEMREEYSEYEDDSWSDNAKEDDIEEQEYIIETGYYDDDIAPEAFVTDDDFDVYFDDDYDDYDDVEDDEDEEDDTYDSEDTELRYKKMLIAAGDPDAYYLSEARKLPDISAQSPERLYAMGKNNPNLLADSDYSPEGIKARAAELSPKFREIADELITAEGIANAFKGMDAATDKLYRLLIEPFVEIEKYRFNRHLASEA